MCEVGFLVHDYSIICEVGQGTFAHVFKACHTPTNVCVALKVIEKASMDKSDTESLFREVSIMKSLSHPHIAEFYEFFEDELNYYISMEFMERGSLLDFINSHGRLDETISRKLFIQIISALDYLHNTKSIVHRDIKPENVLLDLDLNAKIVDFGFAHNYTTKNPYLMTMCGSPAYISPELLRKEEYTAETDIWSVGIVLYAMVAGVLPFIDSNISVMFCKILNDEPCVPPILSAPLHDLIIRILNKDPTKRLTLVDIMNHPWIKDTLERMKIKQYRSSESLPPIDQNVILHLKILGFKTDNISQGEHNIKLAEKTLLAYNLINHQYAKKKALHPLHSSNVTSTVVFRTVKVNHGKKWLEHQRRYSHSNAISLVEHGNLANHPLSKPKF